MNAWALVLGVATALIVALLLLMYLSALRRPRGDPRSLRGIEGVPIAVCAGDSLTAATLGGDYVDMTRRQTSGRLVVINAGKNGDTSHGLLARLDEVINCRPRAVTILIGTNDAILTLVPLAAKRNRHPERTAPEGYRRSLTEIVHRLNGANIPLALLSPPPLGEDVGSELNRKLQEYVAIVKAVAAAHGVCYLPFNEELTSVMLQRVVPARPFAMSLSLSWGAAFRRYFMRQGWNAIADQNGLVTLVDHIHLSDRGAEVAARLVMQFLQQQLNVPSRRT